MEDGSQIIRFSVRDHSFYVYDKEDGESVSVHPSHYRCVSGLLCTGLAVLT